MKAGIPFMAFRSQESKLLFIASVAKVVGGDHHRNMRFRLINAKNTISQIYFRSKMEDYINRHYMALKTGLF